MNSANIIEWNTDKHYLQDLDRGGVSIAPSVFFEKGGKY